MMKRLVLCLAASVALAGCGGNISLSNTAHASLRVVNDYVDVNRVNANLSGTPLLQNQPFAFVSTYQNVDTGSKALNFFDAGTNSLLATRQVDLADGSRYEGIGVGTLAKGRHIIFLPVKTGTAGQAQVRFLNADENVQAVDVYFTPPGTTDLTGEVPLMSNVQFADETVQYMNIDAGSYRIWITPPNKPTTLTAGFDETITAGTNETLILLNGSSGITMQQLQDSSS